MDSLGSVGRWCSFYRLDQVYSVHLADSWNRGQILSAADLGRFLVFSSIAGTTVATPALLAFLTILFARGQVPELRSNSDGGAATKQREDFGNVVVTHVDAAT